MKMWEKGISAYLGLGPAPSSVLSYLQIAHRYGYTRLFTSLHIPEADKTVLLGELQNFIETAASLGFSISADVSTYTFELLGNKAKAFASLKKWGLTTIRPDFGFTPEELAALTHSSAMEIELNASTTTPEVLKRLLAAKPAAGKLRACHNYYPRPETGLAFPLFAERSRLFQHWGIPVAAFIPSQALPRGPLFAGLPTLERHRLLSPQTAAKELLASRLVDGILFGDPFVAENELAAVAALKADCIELQVHTAPNLTAVEREILFSGVHTNRLDPGEQVIRSQEARLRCHSSIPARCTGARPAGAVTLDNSGYARYMGELQLVLAPLPSDDRVNIAARIIPEEVFLLKYITPGRTFCLKDAGVITEEKLYAE